MNPYSNLPEISFWKTAIAQKNIFDIDGLWSPKFNLMPAQNISTYGSCFAQHIGKALVERGYSWLNTESAPYGLSPENCKAYNYNIFSCRTGNIYTTSLLRQWTAWALQDASPPDEYWSNGSRIIDPFRPNIEPSGFGDVEEMAASRKKTISLFRESILKSDVIVFTLGLTESWFNKHYKYEYPMCPGTVAGEYKSNEHVFLNQGFEYILKNLSHAVAVMREANSHLKFILTVSPVPLTATNSGKHVLVATMESKSILRAVAGQLAAKHKFIDYFPSYEIINGPPFRGVFFESNQRSVGKKGVGFVMDTFFNSLHKKYGKPIPDEQKIAKKQDGKQAKTEDELVCEEMVLEMFSSK